MLMTGLPGGPAKDCDMGFDMGYDAELVRHTEVLRRVWAVGPRDHVLDIGCGAGQTTRAAAREAPGGDALGVDVSARAVARARELARAEGLRNVAFEVADAQAHGFAPARFELAVSRFGTMFFADPVAAFTNIGRALRPAGRLVMLVWQGAERNEWDVTIRRALTGSERTTPVADPGPDPFSLADPAALRAILRAAGFIDISLTEVREPVFHGPDVAAALGWVRGFTSTDGVLKRLHPTAAAAALERLREALTAHLGHDGVWFDARAWLVSARRG
jgi:SAM-dependent methyltransferase